MIKTVVSCVQFPRLVNEAPEGRRVGELARGHRLTSSLRGGLCSQGGLTL